MKFVKIILFGFLVICSLGAFCSEVIGSYANGCIAGAKPLHSGEHYQIQKWGKDRNYGHPSLLSFINNLSVKAKKNKLPALLVGDLSSPVGGSFGPRSNHGSHQSGLDVDISFDFANPKKTEYELSHPKDIYIVDTKNNRTKQFNQNHVKLIYLAASDPKVERIFVAPGIKKTLCDLYKNEDRAWLSKIRPWFGHRAHMHVRLKCPVDSPSCQKQDPVPSGDGCGAELYSWLHPKAPDPKNKTFVKKKKVPPKKCQKLFESYKKS